MPSSQTCWCCQPTTSSHPPPSQIHTHDLDDRDDCTACTRRPLPASARCIDCIDCHLVAPAATPSGGLDAGRGHSGPDRGAQGLHDAMDRRNRNSNDSQRQRPRQRSNPNVFADDYALDPDEDDFMPAVSDGFRPSNTGDAWHGDRQDHDRNDASHSQFTSSKSPDGDLRRMATRNSTTKAFESSSSSALHDGRPPGMQNSHSNHHHQASNSQSSPLQHRESISSTGSFATMTRSESPFTTGPSHPYGMYPQLTAARPASISTASTQRQPQRSLSLQRPAHPYAMYSQSGIDDDQPEERPAVPQIQTSIPIGFPGLNMGYHRVIGPDGEEQDIIGPDGHTEQLPPYSRYPEEGPTKASLAAEASASRIVPVAEPMAHPDDPFHTPVSPVSPLLPPLSSVTPARLPPQRPETQTGSVATSTSSTAHASSVPAPATDSSSASLLATEQGISEKAEEVILKSDWRKKKLWGRIPMGVAAILLVLVLIFAIVLGAAIGTYVGKKDKNKPKHDGDHGSEDPIPQVTGPTHTLFGATPISTPAGLSPLPTGAYALPLGIPQENNPGCLTQANQYSAWSCRMTFAPLVLTVNDTLTGPDGNPRQMASIEATKRISDGTIQYGPQPPALLLQPMQLVLDLDYKAFGPAYHFSTRYDKVVVLRQDEFGAGASLRKREGDKPPPDFRTRFQVMPGDFPWFCVWNQTYIEGYIYVQDNSTAGAYLNPSPTTLPPGVSPPTSQSDSSVASQVSTPSSTTGSGPTSAGAAQQTSPSLLRRGEDGPPRTPPYPRIVKVEERRLPGSPQPYCQKMLLLDNGQVAPALNNNENPVRIYLQEDDPTLEEYFQMQPTSSSGSGTSVRRRSDLEKRVDPSNACHCQWMFK